ncbi:MAG: DUF5615 family PIN-like protein [Chloroflexi bacterium]|nr:DUF5615 family PIN-like protein [Chloroflexota bacterium]
MRILLDECLPRRLKREFVGHDVATVSEMGWQGEKNGELLQLAAGRFDIFVTIDQNLRYQQPLSRFGIAMLLLTASNNQLATLKPLMPAVLQAIKSIRPGDVVRVSQ